MSLRFTLNRKKFWLIYGASCTIGLAMLILAGCAQKKENVAFAMPVTPEEAGIEVLDSSQCETCHMSPEMIASFENPNAPPPVAEGG